MKTRSLVTKIGRFVPSCYVKQDIRAGLNKILNADKACVGWEVRSIADAKAIHSDSRQIIQDWHADGYRSNDGSRPPYVVFWVNENPTQVRSIKTKKKYVLEPFDVVLLDNRRVEHKQPQ